MIGALVAILSLNLTGTLVAGGTVARTLPITGATSTTPVAITVSGHGIPMARVAHAVVSGVGGMPETTGTWVLTPTDANTLTLTTLDAQGNVENCVGAGTYTSGGIAQIAFPDNQILLGRQMLALASAVASPRIVFIPTTGRAWSFEAEGGLGPPNYRSRGSAEQQTQRLTPSVGTEYTTFEVYVTGAANPPQPNYGDLDAAQSLVWLLAAACFDALPGIHTWLREEWPSQAQQAASNLQRGQQWKGLLEVKQAVSRSLGNQFAPPGVSLTLTVEPQGAASSDQTVIVIPSH